MSAAPKAKEDLKTWRERADALRHLPPLLAEVWRTQPYYAFCSLFARLISAFLPVGILYVSKLLVDEVIRLAGQPAGTSLETLWRLLAVELGLVLASDLIGRLQGLTDSLLGDLFTNHITLRLMRHAASLDLGTFEDPAFQDKLERARRQTTDRLSMLFLLGSLFQQILSLVAMSASVIAWGAGTGSSRVSW